MAYIILNAIASFVGGFLGLRFKKHLSQDHLDSILLILNLTIVIIGIDGAIKMDDMSLMLISVCIGSIIGVKLNIDGKFKSLGDKIQAKLSSQDLNISRAFVTVSIIQCVGAMAILGPFKLMLEGDSSILVLKSILDFISSIVFASTYGVGVLFASISIIIYQGTIYLLAGIIKPILTEVVIGQISAIGSLLILALGVDLLGIKEIKVSNYLPSILIPIIFSLFKTIFLLN